MKVNITPNEVSAHLEGTTGHITFDLMAWPAPVKVQVPNVQHTDVVHPGAGFCRMVYAKGIQYIAIYQSLAPLQGQKDSGLVVFADASGKVVQQFVRSGADMCFNSHYLPAFLLLQAGTWITTKPGATTIYQAPDGSTYSIDERCDRLFIKTRFVSFGSVTGCLWRTVDGAYILQDYYKGRQIQLSRHSCISDGAYALDHAGAPDVTKVPPMPYHMRDHQESYNAKWMRQQYRQMHMKGLYPVIQLEGIHNVFSYGDGTRIYASAVVTPEGTVKRPEALYEYNITQRSWIVSAFHQAELDRLKKQKQPAAKMYEVPSGDDLEDMEQVPQQTAAAR